MPNHLHTDKPGVLLLCKEENLRQWQSDCYRLQTHEEPPGPIFSSLSRRSTRARRGGGGLSFPRACPAFDGRSTRARRGGGGWKIKVALFCNLSELEKKNGQTTQPYLPQGYSQKFTKPFHSSRSNTLEDFEKQTDRWSKISSTACCW